MKDVRKIALVLLFLMLMSLAPSRIHADVPYDVEIEGICSKETIALLKTVSQLVTLEEHPPATLTGLERRAETDIPNIIKGLHSFGYFDAKATYRIDEEACPVKVFIMIDAGPVYTFKQFIMTPSCGDEDEDDEEESDDEDEEEDDEDDEDEIRYPLETIDPLDLGIIYNTAALPKMIIDAEKALIQLMAKKGFPLGRIVKRNVVADHATKTVEVTLFVDSGPRVLFGPINITGNVDVDEAFIRKKIAWCEGDLYKPRLIERTQLALESSGLFSSATITPSDELDDDGRIATNIELIEGRHRTIGFGASYNTELGAGVTANWEHRNIRGMGEKLSLRTDIWQILQRGTVLYAIPDFKCPGQDLLWLLEAEREITKGFTESFVSFSGIINRKIRESTEISYGGSFKQLDSEDSNDNGSFTLLKVPFQMKWNKANNLLDPTSGVTLNFKTTPTVKVNNPQVGYCINTLTGTAYYPLDEDHRYVIASKLMLGTIFGSSNYNIPPPERFYAGSENTLRGYQYLTVSPLNRENKPIGGRSMMIYNLELRTRFSETFGGVLFYDVGNVYSQVLPQITHSQLNSVGLGIRYHTPVGPLRADFSFPLNPRKGLDRNFQIYFSIGQAF